MPRTLDYYEKRIDEFETAPAPQEQVPLETPQTAPAGPILAEPASETTLTQSALAENLNRAKQRAFDDHVAREANRSIASRLPYEFANTLWEMPDEMDWQEMSFWEKTQHASKETAKMGWRMIKSFPQNVAKAPLKLSHTLLEGESRLLSKAMGTKSYMPPKYKLPLVGEVRGAGASYDEGRALGLSPFMSFVKASGETAGDLAITLSALELSAAATRPRLKPISKPVTAKDIRAKVLKQVKVKGTKGGTAEVFESAQNPNVSYIKLPAQVAKQYKGTVKNTFLKVSPLKDGTAEYSVIRVKPALTQVVKNKIAQGIGKSKVVKGSLGNEIKLESTILKPKGVKTQPKELAIVDQKMFRPEKIASRVNDMAQKLDDAIFGIGKSGGKEAAITTKVKGLLKTKLKHVDSPGHFYREIMKVVHEDKSITPIQLAAIKKSLAETTKDFWIPNKWVDKMTYSQSVQAFKKIEGYIDIAEKEIIKPNIVPIYHWAGTTPIEQHVKSTLKEGGLKPHSAMGKGKYFAFDKKSGEMFGTKLEKRYVDLNQMKVMDMTDVPAKEGFKHPFAEQFYLEGDKFPDIFAFAKSKGYDAIKFWDDLGVEKHLVVDPTKVNVTPTKDMLTQKALPKSALSRLSPRAVKSLGAGTTAAAEAGTASMVDTVSDTITPQEQTIPTEVRSVMSAPLKGQTEEIVTGKQLQQIDWLQEDIEMADPVVQLLARTVTGKENLNELSQTEAYDLSETMRQFITNKDSSAGDDWQFIMRSYTHPARYWMESAERELGYPVYSEVFLPIETAGRFMKVHNDRWQGAARDVFGKYAAPKFTEERRLITEYIEGNKEVITSNAKLGDATKQELVEIGDWLIEQYKGLFEDLGIESERFFSKYSPNIRKLGGIYNLYKDVAEMPAEIKPFFEFEREGMLSPMEDDALALFDIYTRAAGKKLLMHEPLEHAKRITETLPRNVNKAVNDYMQEKLGYQDSWMEYGQKLGEKLSKWTGGAIPQDITKQLIDHAMTNSYAGALGLPRIMPIFRNSIQSLLTTYPEVGPEWYAKGVKGAFSKEGLKELSDKGFFVKMGVPYGAELTQEAGRGLAGKTLDKYKRFNQLMMGPYAGIDAMNRAITYHAVKVRLNENWENFLGGKIDYGEFERSIDMDGFSPTMQKVLREKFLENTPESMEEALDLMGMDVLDRTQFPYRKGSESRLHYGLKGKAGLQFAQWSWEYAFTLKSWVSRGQWDKLVRWLGMGTLIKRSVEDAAGIDVSKWVNTPSGILGALSGEGEPGAAGPFSGFPLGPLGKAGMSFISGVNASFLNMHEEVNQHKDDVVRALKIFLGTAGGVGVDKIKNFWKSQERFEAGISVSPDPSKPYGVYSSTGKLIRWTDFSEQLQILFGFQTEEGAEFSERITRIKKEKVEYDNKINTAMEHLVDGEYKKFDEAVQKDNLLIPDISAKIKSYTIPLDQRIFDRMPPHLKIKYFNIFFPAKE